MTFETLFGLFYTKFRGEESPPDSSDPEWEIAVRNYNNALDRLEEVDDVRWSFLKTTLQKSTQNSPALDRTLTTGDTSFTCPTDMLWPGGLYWKIDTNGNRQIPNKVSSLEDVSMTDQNSQYGYFMGDQHNGYTFYINPTVPSSENGWSLDYMYYKKATRLNPSSETGTSVIVGASPEFLACYMAAQRFLDSRNFPAYQVMKRDSEEALKGMKTREISGDFYNQTSFLGRNSGPGFGV